MKPSASNPTPNEGARLREAELSILPDEIRTGGDDSESCRRLRRFAVEPDPAAPSSEAERRITAALLSNLRPVRPLPSRGVLALGFLAIFGVVSALTTAVAGVSGARQMTLWQTVGVLLVVVASAAGLSFTLSRRMTPGAGRSLPPGWLALAILLPLGMVTLALFPWDGNWLPQSWHCLSSGCLFALPAAALSIALLRRGAPQAWGAVGAAAGLLGGLVGMATLHLGCSLTGAPHIMTQHVMAPALGAVAGYGLGFLWDRFGRWR